MLEKKRNTLFAEQCSLPENNSDLMNALYKNLPSELR